MKVSLVVATGSHAGKAIPLTGPQFLIGRDPQCNLRPASQAISKLHCAVIIRDGKVYLKDYGSTNGTTVNGELVQDTEVQIADGATIHVGPLDFRVRVEGPVAVPDGTPLPGGSGEAAALAAVKAAVAAAPQSPARDATPAPVRPSGVTGAPAAKPTKPGGAPAKPSPAAKDAVKPGSSEGPSLTSSESTSDDDHDRIAAMLLGMDEDGNGTGSVPDGSTVMDIPVPLLGGAGEAKPDDKKKDDKPQKAQTREEMSSAANDLLRKYMRRPK